MFTLMPRTVLMCPQHSCIEEESSKNPIENAVIMTLYEMTSSCNAKEEQGIVYF